MPKRSPLKRKLKLTEFYCVGCSKRVAVDAEDIKIKKDINGRPRLVSIDDEGHKLFKYISPDDQAIIKRKLRSC
jgi:hypothetical protein